MEIKNESKIDYLTGLKGLACLAVSINHFMGAFGLFSDKVKESWYCVFFNGTYMVSLFIMLSCFFLAYSFFRNKSVEKLGRSIFTRYFRLSVPIAFVMMAISALMRMNMYKYWDIILPLTGAVRKEADAANYYAQYGMLDAVKTAFSCLFAGTTKFTFVVWMLPTLFKAYMYTALIAIGVEKCKPVFKLIFLALAYYLVSHYCGNSISLAVFAVILAYFYVDIYPNLSNGNHKTQIIQGGGMLLIAILIGTYWPGASIRWHSFMLLNGDYNFWYGWGSFFMVLAIAMIPVLQKALMIKPILVLGEVSFGFYLLHDPVQCTFGTWLYYNIYKLSESRSFSVIIVGIGCFVVTVIAAYLFYRFVDTPVQKGIEVLYGKIINN